jgi:serine phosphatase RsbU (regulator of sigma subunit)
MTLRAKLILAFLFLAAIPLIVVTVYSYASSVDALRRTVERESGNVAEQMGERMELVAEDLDRRVERLGRLPFGSLTAGDVDSESCAGDFAAGLVEEMGDSAVLLDSLEFVPAAPQGRDAGVPRAPKAPREPVMSVSAAAPVVIHLSRMLFNSDTVRELEDLRDGTSVVRGEDGLILLPRGVVETRVEIDSEELIPSELFDALIEIGEQAQADALGGGDAVDRSMEEKVRVFAERIKASVGHVEERRQEMAQRVADREEAHWEWKRELDFPVQRDGELVGSVKARVNAQQALHSVLGQVDYASGEIPFAVDDRGNVFTLDKEHEEILGDLQLLGLASEGAPTSERVVGDWVTVTREKPQLGLIFGIARPIGESLEEIRGVNARNLGYGLAVVGLAVFGIFPLSSRMTRDLTELSAGAARLSSGDLETEVPVRSRDEIGQLAGTFNRMTSDLRRNQQRLVAQERLSKELEMSRQIQEELLPHVVGSFPFAEVKGVSIPAREVGGDFFNYFSVPGGDVAIVMGDVSGKGMPAALLMANLQATLKARMPHERNLAELTQCLDIEIDGSTPSESYVTLFVAILSHERLTLRYVNAGHNVQFVVREGGLERLEAGGRPLGLLPGGRYTERSLELSPGDFLFLFTDGLTEAENARGEEFGTNRLEQLLLEARADKPDHLLQRVEEAVSRHRGETDATDDATMLALRVGAPRSAV